MLSAGRSQKGNETIAAISSPSGEGGIGIVRLSGAKAFDIARALFRKKSGSPAREFRSHNVLYGFVVDPRDGQPADEVLLNTMFAPCTYTTEDIVEINCHGGRAVLQKVLELAIAQGARLAEPGEFTKRAFLGGRIDLAQAEAVAELIRAKSEASLRAAMALLRGDLTREIAACEEDLLGALANLEASIDFPEEDLETSDCESLSASLVRCIAKVDRLVDSYRQGRLARDGAAVVIVGKPNVGKSSLLNALLRCDRAIVSPVPGTTRDVIEESICIKGRSFRLFDTAGVRRARGQVEKIGVSKSRGALEEADMALLVVDASMPLNGSDRCLFTEVAGKRAICVLNKTDLPPAIDEGLLRSELPGLRIEKVSAKRGDGMARLKEAIYSGLEGAAVRNGDEPMVVKLRHQQALGRSRAYMKRALKGLKKGISPEFVAIDLRAALGFVGEISGKDATEGLLERIFEEFCIGK